MQRTLTSFLVATLSLIASHAHAASFDVNPIVIELSAKTGTATIAVKNRSTEPARFHLTASAWSQREDGEMSLLPTKELVFFPAILTLQPQESRQIRVGAKVKPGATERAYRIFIQELPGLQKVGEHSEVENMRL